jgi:hypothetical protein
MADQNQLALRLLEPRWTTIVGTVHQFQDMALERRLRGGQMWIGTTPGAEPVGADYDGWRRLWLHRDGRSRVEHFAPGQAPYATVIDEGKGHQIELVPGQQPHAKQSFRDPITWVGHPLQAVGGQDVEVGAELEFAGRHAVELVLRPRSRWGFGVGASQLGLPLGDESRLVIDAGSGVALRIATFVEGRLFAYQQFTEVDIDGNVDEGLFRFEAAEGVTVRGPGADLLDRLRAMGADVADVDPFDMDAVHRAMRERRPQGPPPGWRPPRTRRLAELVVPMGDLPDDVDAVEREIRRMFDRLSSDAVACIERGEQLRPGLQRAGGRIGVSEGRPATWSCTDLALVRDDEALVRFTVGGPAGATVPGSGRVVRRDGQWLLTYETVAQLLQMAGVTPPRADGTDDDGDETRGLGPGAGPDDWGPNAGVVTIVSVSGPADDVVDDDGEVGRRP